MSEVRRRASAVVVACMLCMLAARSARADQVADNVQQLGDSDTGYKSRLAAALALSKSKDPRAIIALSEALGKDSDSTVRRVAALALEKQLDAHTAPDALALALEALDKAAATDRDTQVRGSAASALRVVGGLRKTKTTKAATAAPHGDKPEVFVTIDAATDQSKKAPREVADGLTRIVKSNIEKTGYATSWPGGPPTGAELAKANSKAFIVASTVKKVDITKKGQRVEIACTVAIRVAPWSGKDGGEKWEANKAASASGSAKASTGGSDRDIRGGVRDCLEAVAEDITARQVVPFLKRLVVASAP